MLVGVAGATAAGQSIHVVVVNADSRTPVGSAEVGLLDSTGAVVARGVTDRRGTVTVRSPAPGRFSLRADLPDRITGRSATFVVSDSITITMVMPATRAVLPELAVSARAPCGVASAEVAALWSEVERRLTMQVRTERAGEVPLAVTRFRRLRTLSGVLKSETTVDQYLSAGPPFAYADPAFVDTAGFIQRVGDGFRFFAPGADYLLSATFLGGHCLSLTASPHDSTLVGLTFEPRRGRRRGTITGVLWTDRQTGALSHLEFEYVDPPSAVALRGIGGRVSYAQFDDGRSYVSDWYIRSPDRVRYIDDSPLRNRRAVDTTIGFVDLGGVASPSAPLLELYRLEAPEVTHATVDLGEVRMKVVRPDGAAIEGAQLNATRDDSTWTTDGTGLGYIANWPLGPLGIRVSAIGFAPRLVQLRLSERQRLVDTVIVLQPVAQPLAPLTVTGAPTPIAGRMIDFERRRAMGFGSFLTRADLEKWSAFPLSMALREVRGLALLARSWACGSGFGVGSFRGHRQIGCVYLRACPFSIYLDGVRVYDGDGPIPNIDDYLPDHLEGIEVYRGAGEAPIEFNATGGICGTVVLWSRVSPATADDREPPDRGGP